MYTVNSKGENVQTNEPIHFMKPEAKLERMKLFTEILKNNFPEDVDFTYAHQPLYTHDAVIFFCRTAFSAASKIVNEANDINRHLDEPIEKLDLMRSLIQRKESGRMCWYCLTVGMFIIERNLYDCQPINIRYIEPVPYISFMRDFRSKMITQEELAMNKLCQKYAILGGLNLGDTELLLSKSFERDYLNGESAKDQKMKRFALAWKKQKIGSASEMSNVASIFLANTQKKRKDCFVNYKELKNFFVKNYKRTTGIRYDGNLVTAVLPNGEKVSIYLYGTVDNPQFVIGSQIVSTLSELKELIDLKTYQKEAQWFIQNVKPFL